MTATLQKRQGDLFFKAVAKPSKGELKKYNSAILAHGEVTGHHHSIVSPSLDEIDMLVDEEGHIYMQSDKTIVIEHQEHAPIELPPGSQYCMTRQREYDPVMEERKVQD